MQMHVGGEWIDKSDKIDVLVPLTVRSLIPFPEEMQATLKPLFRRQNAAQRSWQG